MPTRSGRQQPPKSAVLAFPFVQRFLERGSALASPLSGKGCRQMEWLPRGLLPRFRPSHRHPSIPRSSKRFDGKHRRCMRLTASRKWHRPTISHVVVSRPRKLEPSKRRCQPDTCRARRRLVSLPSASARLHSVTVSLGVRLQHCFPIRAGDRIPAIPEGPFERERPLVWYERGPALIAYWM
ncbi:hypothetical protein BJ166DRAFT_270623 [Pestalotiopsis sp. NC0098]|nr:hypothetical protein BJ166DRAFT_270623 [Pestalotiopsis sp. NC0098]